MGLKSKGFWNKKDNERENQSILLACLHVCQIVLCLESQAIESKHGSLKLTQAWDLIDEE